MLADKELALPAASLGSRKIRAALFDALDHGLIDSLRAGDSVLEPESVYIDLSRARDNKLEWQGKAFGWAVAQISGSCAMRLNNPNKPSIDLTKQRQNGQMLGAVYVTNAAQPGKIVELMVYKDPMYLFILTPSFTATSSAVLGTVGIFDATDQRINPATNESLQALAQQTTLQSVLARLPTPLSPLTASMKVSLEELGVILQTEGDAAHGAVDAGNPLKVGAKASSATPVAVSAGQRVNIWADLNGRVSVWDGNSTLSVDDAGNSLTVDGTVSVTGTVTITGTVAISGTVLVDTELPAAGALADSTANPTTTIVGSFPHVYNGTNWDRARGDTFNGLDVDVTRVQGTVTVIGASADNSANSTAKLPVLAARANAAAPTFTEDNQNPLSVDLSGSLRVTVTNTVTVATHAVTQSGAWTVSVSGTVTISGTVSISGTVTVAGGSADNSANSSAKLPVLPARANALAPTFTEGNQNPLSVDLSGSLRCTVTNTVTVGTHAVTQSGAWTVSISGTVTVSGTVSVSGTVTVAGGSADNSANSSTKLPVLAARANALAPTFTEGNQNPLSVDLAGSLRVIVTNTVTVATHAVTQSGAWNVAINAALPTGANVIGAVTQSGAWTVSISGTVTVAGTVTANQGGAWTVSISGTPNVAVTSNVAVANRSTIGAGQVSVGVTAVQLTAQVVPNGFAVVVKASSANTGKIYLGPSGVLTTTGDELVAGEARKYYVTNVNVIRAISDTASQLVTWSVET